MKRIVFLLLFFIITQGVWAQDTINVPLPKSLRLAPAKIDDGKDKKVNFRVGGNFGVQIGTLMGLQLQPDFGVIPVKWLCIGVKGSYVFRWNTLTREVSHIFGVSPYVEAYAFKRKLIVHLAYEYVNFPQYEYNINNAVVERYRSSSHVALLGAGYRMEVSQHSSINILLLFPVFQYNSDNLKYYSYWYMPIIRIGYGYSF